MKDINDNTKHQSNLVKRGIAFRFYPPGGSSYLRFHVSAGGLTQIVPSPEGQEPCLTQCVIGPHKSTCQMASKSSLSKVHACDRRQTVLRRNV